MTTIKCTTNDFYDTLRKISRGVVHRRKKQENSTRKHWDNEKGKKHKLNWERKCKIYVYQFLNVIFIF